MEVTLQDKEKKSKNAAVNARMHFSFSLFYFGKLMVCRTDTVRHMGMSGTVA